MPEIPQGGIPGGDDSRPPSYRVQLLDAEGIVRSSMPILATDDEDAKAVAQRMANGLAAELWDSLRFIERFEACVTG